MLFVFHTVPITVFRDWFEKGTFVLRGSPLFSIWLPQIPSCHEPFKVIAFTFHPSVSLMSQDGYFAEVWRPGMLRYVALAAREVP